jgi:hypothetical protein
MKKHESRVLLTEDQFAEISRAAKREGMPLSTYLRHCALARAAATAPR